MTPQRRAGRKAEFGQVSLRSPIAGARYPSGRQRFPPLPAYIGYFGTSVLPPHLYDFVLVVVSGVPSLVKREPG